MAITNDQPITDTDLNNMLNADLGDLQADNAQLPLGGQFDVYFPNLVASTTLKARQTVFVAPCDLLIESVAVQASEFTAASELTLEIEADSDDALSNLPLTVTGDVGAGVTKLPRLLFDGTPTHPNDDPAGTLRTFRVFPKGTTFTITAETDSVATPSTCQVAIVWRQFFQRE